MSFIIRIDFKRKNFDWLFPWNNQNELILGRIISMYASLFVASVSWYSLRMYCTNSALIVIHVRQQQFHNSLKELVLRAVD